MFIDDILRFFIKYYRKQIADNFQLKYDYKPSLCFSIIDVSKYYDIMAK